MTAPLNEATPPGPVRSPAPYSEDLTLLSLGNTLLRRWRLLVLLPLACGLLGALIVLLQPRQFVATSIFAPEAAQSSSSRVAGLAAQFGFSLGGAAGTSESLDFYASLLRTRSLLADVVSTEYRVPREGDTASVTLIDVYDIEAPTPEQEVRAAIRELTDGLQAIPDTRTGTVTLEIRAPSPHLAVAVSERLLQLVDDFNVARRQTQATEEFEFVTGRLDAAREALRDAESQLQAFLDQNRTYEASSQLRFEAARLEREVSLRQAVYNTLAQSVEQAGIEKVRTTPVLTIVEHPSWTVRSEGRNYRMAFVMGIVGGLVIGIGLAFVLEFLDREKRQNPQEFAEARRLVGRIRSDMTKWLRARPGR